MNTILISYDLRAPGKDYTNLSKHLESYGNWARPLESVWLIRTPSTAVQVRDAALKHVDQNDKIFVVDVTGRHSAWEHLTNEVEKWIGSTL